MSTTVTASRRPSTPQTGSSLSPFTNLVTTSSLALETCQRLASRAARYPSLSLPSSHMTPCSLFLIPCPFFLLLSLICRTTVLTSLSRTGLMTKGTSTCSSPSSRTSWICTAPLPLCCNAVLIHSGTCPPTSGSVTLRNNNPLLSLPQV